MLIEQMHYDFRVKYNKINSNNNKNWTDPEIDNALNNGINEYFEIFSTGNNRKRFKLGFEVTGQRVDMLSTLLIGQPEQELLAPSKTDTNLNIYEFKLSDLKYTYGHYVRGYVTVSGCSGTFRVDFPEQHVDLNRVLEDEHRKPSKVWKRAVGVIKKTSSELRESSLYIYTNGDFTVTGLYLEYLKRPAEVCLGTYRGIPTVANPKPSVKPQVQCDIPDNYHYLVVDIAVQEVYRRLGMPQEEALREKRNINIAH